MKKKPTTTIVIGGALLSAAMAVASTAGAEPSDTSAGGQTATDPVIISPNDILSDDANAGVLDGVEVRKGTVGAWVANVKKLEALQPSDPGYAELAAYVREEAVKVKAVGVFDILAPRSPRLAEIINGL
jgi:hypothetical protein